MTLFKPFSHIKTRIFLHIESINVQKRVIYKRKFFLFGEKYIPLHCKK